MDAELALRFRLTLLCHRSFQFPGLKTSEVLSGDTRSLSYSWEEKLPDLQKDLGFDLWLLRYPGSVTV